MEVVVPEWDVGREHLLRVSTPGYFERVSEVCWHLGHPAFIHFTSVSILVSRFVRWMIPPTKVERLSPAIPIMIAHVSVVIYCIPIKSKWSIFPGTNAIRAKSS